jgi:uncharacterized membrane protein YgdD (TMEM256/DUF423 family)
MGRIWIVGGAVAALGAVAAGAFAAHGLRPVLSTAQLDTFTLAAQYQMYHALALLAVGILYRQQPQRGLQLAGGLFTAGIVLFCGSLYLLALTGHTWLGPITPLGGLCFLGGWLSLASGAWSQR